MQELIGKWGSETVKAAMNYTIDHTEKRVREEVAKWPDGKYEANVYV